MSLLNKLTNITTKSKKRIGRGFGSGKGGHTVGFGNKGQKSRQGGKVPLWFEGGQLPLIKRLPMLRGKSRLKAIHPVAVITFNDLNKLDAENVTIDTLKLNKLVDKKAKKVKIIKRGRLNKKVNIVGIKVSKQAKQIIEKMGGKVTSQG